MSLKMKKTTLIVLTLALLFSVPQLFADVLVSNEGYQYLSDQMIVSTERGVPALRTGDFTTSGFTTGVQSLDKLCAQYGVIEVEPWYKGKVKNAMHLKDVVERMYIVTIDETHDVRSVVNAFSTDDNLEYAELYDIPVPFYDPNDPRINQQWFLGNINAYEAWDVIRGDATRVAVIGISDTGVYYVHPDLEPNMWINEPEDINGNGIFDNFDEIDGGDLNYDDEDDNGYDDDVVGYDLGVNDPDPQEESPEHGTHVAGCASAATDNGIGVAGPGFSARIIAAKGANRNGSLTAVYQAIVYSADNGAQIVNCSWGSTYYNQGNQNVITAAYNDGCLPVCAAGNDNTSQLHYPSGYENAFAVAATRQQDVKASYSNYGEWIDISAPGTDIHSTWATNTYLTTQGTSMASPVTSGVAALVFAQDFTRGPSDLEVILLSSADSVSLYAANPGYMGQLGRGRVDAYAALAAATMPNIVYGNSSMQITNDDGDGIPNPGENVSLVVTVENLWNDAVNVNGTLRGNSSVTVSDSTASFGDIAGGGQGDNSSDPFIVEIHADAIVESFEMTLVITADGDYSNELGIPFEISLNQLRFPYNVEGSIEGSMGFARIDGDGRDDLVFGTSDDKVYVINSNGDVMPGFPVNVNGDVVGGIAVGKILDTGWPLELAVATKTGNLYVITASGAIAPGFPITVGSSYYSTPTLGDLDGDGLDEMIFAAFGDGHVYAYNGDGSAVSGFPVSSGNLFYGSAAVGDIDNDGSLEIVAGSLDGNVHAWNHDGSVIGGFPVSIGSQVWVSPALGDVGGDSQMEIICGDNGGSLYALNADGSVVSGFPVGLGSTIKSDPALANVDGDSELEIFVGTNGHMLYGVNGDGSMVNGFPIDVEYSITSSPVIADVDGDGSKEILASTVGGNLCGYNVDGSVLRNFPIPTYGTLTTSSIAIGDMDADGDLEFAVGLRQSEGNVVVIDYKDAATTDGYDWRMYGHDIGRSHRWYDTPVSVDEEESGLPLNFELSQNYPNPFNPETRINYSIASSGSVSLTVYNIIGQEVVKLVDTEQSAGRYEVVWDGRSNSGEKISSGIYFYRLNTNDNFAIKKMLLMK
ncbi:MAG: S8 family serine peptidase [candidate division Zixibacteria bacterium]|nr:S8 family serine peptidase [candidate division Zixibacteria bacterium]